MSVFRAVQEESRFCTLPGLPSRWTQKNPRSASIDMPLHKMSDPRRLESSYTSSLEPQISHILPLYNKLKQNYNKQTKKQPSSYANLKGILHCHIGITEWYEIKIYRGVSVPIRISFNESSLPGFISCEGARNCKMPNHSFNAENADLKRWKSDTGRKFHFT